MPIELSAEAICSKRGFVLTCYLDGRKVFRPVMFAAEAATTRTGESPRPGHADSRRLRGK